MYDTPDSPMDASDPDEFSADLTDAAEVWCPYCGESVEVAVDPGGGPVQEYIEDCQVCCRPWSVRVDLDRDGQPTISVATLDES